MGSRNCLRGAGQRGARIAGTAVGLPPTPLRPLPRGNRTANCPVLCCLPSCTHSSSQGCPAAGSATPRSRPLSRCRRRSPRRARSPRHSGAVEPPAGFRLLLPPLRPPRGLPSAALRHLAMPDPSGTKCTLLASRREHQVRTLPVLGSGR